MDRDSVLLITEDSSFKQLVMSYFQSKSIFIKTVQNYDQALKELNSLDKPNLIFLDISLPENFSFFTMLKEDIRFRNILVYCIAVKQSQDERENKKYPHFGDVVDFFKF
jgi:DNA-binding response OmpR family regulator